MTQMRSCPYLALVAQIFNLLQRINPYIRLTSKDVMRLDTFQIFTWHFVLNFFNCKRSNVQSFSAVTKRNISYIKLDCQSLKKTCLK